MKKTTWYGQSGHKYVFDLLLEGNVPADIPGLYMFATIYPSNGRADALYIGETHSLSDRLKTNHHQYDNALRAGCNAIYLLACNGNDVARKNIETDLIRGVQPPLNQRKL